jgi:hypothetical protein
MSFDLSFFPSPSPTTAQELHLLMDAEEERLQTDVFLPPSS